MHGNNTISTLRYNSVSRAFQPLSTLLKIFGVHPNRLRGGKSSNPLLWIATGSNIAAVIAALILSSVVDFFQDSAVSREITTLMSFWALCVCALGNVIFSLFKGKLNEEFHHKWKMLDKRLGIEQDAKLRRFGKTMVWVFLGLEILFIGTSTLIVFGRREAEDLQTNVMLVTVCALLVWIHSAVILPEMCFVFLCKAIESRFITLGTRIEWVLGTPCSTSIIAHVNAIGEKDVSHELESLRHSYHLLAEITEDTSSLLSPMILFGFLLDSGTICTCMYRLVQIWDFGRWDAPLEMLSILTAILKILVITLLGSTVTNTACDTLQLLPKTSFKDKNRETKYQAQLFALTSADDTPTFSASGFFSIDRRLFTATVGTVATYFVVLLQFKK